MKFNQLYPPVKGSSGGPITWAGAFGFRILRAETLPSLNGLGCQHGLGIVMVGREATKCKDVWKVVEKFQRFLVAADQ